MKGARGGSLKMYISVLNLCSYPNIDYHKRSHSWYAWDFYQANQLEIKLNKNGTQAFCFGLKFWPQPEINETSIFSQRNSFGDKIGGICSQFKKHFTFIIYILTVT